MTADLYTGIIFVSQSGTSNNVNIRLNAQEVQDAEWKKVYIELSELISASPNGSSFLQSFSAFFDGVTSEGLIYMDNIKVLWY